MDYDFNDVATLSQVHGALLKFNGFLSCMYSKITHSEIRLLPPTIADLYNLAVAYKKNPKSNWNLISAYSGHQCKKDPISKFNSDFFARAMYLNSKNLLNDILKVLCIIKEVSNDIQEVLCELSFELGI